MPCTETVPMLLWALLSSGQITMRKVDGWQTLNKLIEHMPLTSQPDQAQIKTLGERRQRISTTFETPPFSRNTLALFDIRNFCIPLTFQKPKFLVGYDVEIV